MLDENEKAISVGEYSLTIFKITGLWTPVEWTENWKLFFYRIYSTFMITVFSIFTFIVCMRLFQEHENIESLSESLLFSSTTIMTIVKIIIVCKRRKIFLKTQEMLLSEICQPKDLNEFEILRNYSLKGRKYSLCFLMAATMAGIMVLLVPFVSKSNRTLPFPVWTKFSLESNLTFFLLYFQEIIGCTMIVQINVAVDTLAIAVLLQLCGQLEIVMYRLNLLSKIPENINHVKYYQELEIFKQCLKRHLHLFAISDNINKQFGISIFMQFFASTIILCTIIYNLSKMSLTSHHSWLMIFCANSYTIQIFIYCYFGQQITEKSSEIGTAIYFLNWNSLTIRSKKSLIILMMRTVRPIKLSAASVIVMSLETFMKILKASYSTYNLLKNSSKSN